MTKHCAKQKPSSRGFLRVGFSYSVLHQLLIQIGIQMFMTAEGNQWGPLMAASTLASLPVLVIYVLLQRQVVQSFMKSGIR